VITVEPTTDGVFEDVLEVITVRRILTKAEVEFKFPKTPDGFPLAGLFRTEWGEAQQLADE
jgi:hypothetical protein